MIDLVGIPEDQLPQTMRYIKQEVIVRNWQATVPYVGSVHCFITRGDGKVLHIFSAVPPSTSYAAAHLANDKFATYQVLGDANIPQPATILTDGLSDIEISIEFMKKNGRVVIKPVDGGHGKGITVGVSTESGLREALEVASKATSGMNSILVQAQYPYDKTYDLRVLCIDYEYVAALQRIPARVFGDGAHTVNELIVIENKKAERGEAYKTKFAKIPLDRAEQHLGDKIHYKPIDGEEINVLGVANYGMGGETIDITGYVPSWMRDQSAEIARIMGLPVVGIDYMTRRLPSEDMTADDLVPIVIEVNKSPSLGMHEDPIHGKSQHVTKMYVDYLAAL